MGIKYISFLNKNIYYKVGNSSYRSKYFNDLNNGLFYNSKLDEDQRTKILKFLDDYKKHYIVFGEMSDKGKEMTMWIMIRQNSFNYTREHFIDIDESSPLIDTIFNKLIEAIVSSDKCISFINEVKYDITAERLEVSI